MRQSVPRNWRTYAKTSLAGSSRVQQSLQYLILFHCRCQMVTERADDLPVLEWVILSSVAFPLPAENSSSIQAHSMTGDGKNMRSRPISKVTFIRIILKKVKRF